jgi:hypothetical protein
MRQQSHALRCCGIGVVLDALGVSEEQVRDALLEGKLMACYILHYVDIVCSVLSLMFVKVL